MELASFLFLLVFLSLLWYGEVGIGDDGDGVYVCVSAKMKRGLHVAKKGSRNVSAYSIIVCISPLVLSLLSVPVCVPACFVRSVYI